ncbi:MAG: uncharacterized protein PWR24_1308 [Desulfonauticus sp.]|jgi:hypothetical protein|nr:MAG: ApbE family lipoprotein [Desulfonauticus sp. 38_4375]MDK2921751.1 uncharacterized protein [Desulfonauticus sp.]
MNNKFLSPFRTYRKIVQKKQEVTFQVVIEESDLFIVAEKDLSLEVIAYVEKLRASLKSYLELNPLFLTSLTPLPFDPKAPPIVQTMLKASQKFQVGPMACVAGTIAEMVAKHFAPLSPNFLVENGGDLYLYSTKDRVIGLLPNPRDEVSLGIKLHSGQFPCSFCTSSGTIGHSLSFGQGDLVGVLSQSGAEADACATFLGNLLKRKQDLPLVLKISQKLKARGIRGVVLQLDSSLGAWGEIELVQI